MRAVRRILIALGAAAAVAAIARLRGRGGVPPTSGGWQEIDPSEAP